MKGRYPHKKVTIDGICFDSGSEGQYYLVLKDLLQEGKIANLERQVPFEVIPEVWEERIKHLKTKDKVEKKRIQQATYYIADFVYDDLETGEHVVVDVKSEATRSDPVYRLKNKMMLAYNGIKIKEVIMAKSGVRTRKSTKREASRPKPSAPRAGYKSSSSRYGKGGRTRKKASV